MLLAIRADTVVLAAMAGVVIGLWLGRR